MIPTAPLSASARPRRTSARRTTARIAPFRHPATALALSCLVLATACGRGPAAEQATGLTEIAPAERVIMPALSGRTLDGSTITLGDLRGSVVVLNAWASWCAPCREEIPVLRAAAQRNPDVRFIGVNVEDDRDRAQAFGRETGIDWPSIIDANGTLLPTIPGVPPAALPSTVILDQDGRIAARIIGAVKGPELDGALARVRGDAS